MPVFVVNSVGVAGLFSVFVAGAACEDGSLCVSQDDLVGVCSRLVQLKLAVVPCALLEQFCNHIGATCCLGAMK